MRMRPLLRSVPLPPVTHRLGACAGPGPLITGPRQPLRLSPAAATPGGCREAAAPRGPKPAPARTDPVPRSPGSASPSPPTLPRRTPLHGRPGPDSPAGAEREGRCRPNSPERRGTSQPRPPAPFLPEQPAGIGVLLGQSYGRPQGAAIFHAPKAGRPIGGRRSGVRSCRRRGRGGTQRSEQSPQGRLQQDGGGGERRGVRGGEADL